jgi:hypothetical protein
VSAAGPAAGAGRRRRGIPIEYLLAVACLVSACVLGYSDFGTSFELTQGGEPIQELAAGDRHSYAMLVLAIFAIGALFVAVGAGSKPAATAVALAGATALILFLAIDLPKANQIGDLNEAGQFLAQAKAEPAAGFWLSLLGALGLAISGGALATLPPEQLLMFGRGTRVPASAAPSHPRAGPNGEVDVHQRRARESSAPTSRRP